VSTDGKGTLQQQNFFKIQSRTVLFERRRPSPNGPLFVTIRDFCAVADLTPGDAVRQRFGHRPAPTYLNFAGRPLDVLDNREKIRETGVSLVQWMFE
jgi:hypothetical protein